MNTARLITYSDEYKKDFEHLNLEWIEKYFSVEDLDREYLQNPREKIIDAGGEVFFVLENEKVVGTCALVKHSPHTYELSKMAVAPAAQGRGYAGLLMDAVIETARERGAKTVFLLSNTILAPAIHLYEKYGFKTIRRMDSHPDYQRANIEMALDLT
jgi:putative acetyltransferase